MSYMQRSLLEICCKEELPCERHSLFDHLFRQYPALVIYQTGTGENHMRAASQRVPRLVILRTPNYYLADISRRLSAPGQV